MNENKIRTLVKTARGLIKNFTYCVTEEDFDRCSAKMTDLATEASEAIRTIANVNHTEAAQIFMDMVHDDAKREMFIAQAFIAQPAAPLAIGA